MNNLSIAEEYIFSPLAINHGIKKSEVDKKFNFKKKSWVSALITLEAIEACGRKRIVKDDLLEDNRKCKALKRVVKYAYHPYKKYFAYPSKEVTTAITDDADTDVNRIKQLLWVLDLLEGRKVTGDAARALLTESVSWGNSLEKKWMRRIANRDFKCGVSNKTFHKWRPKLIPEFNVPLSDKYADHDVTFPVWGEIKFDGHRMFIIYDAKKDKIINMSRSGKEKENVWHIMDEIKSFASKKNLKSFVLDGELFGESFNDTGLGSRKATKDNAEAAKKLKFNIFDMLPLKDFKNELCSKPLSRRRQKLERFFNKAKFEFSKLSPITVLNNEVELMSFYNEAVDAGHEGVMVKDINSPYSCTRNKHWLKIKPNHDVSVRVVKVHLGSGKNENRMGAIEVELENGETSFVGGGWRDTCKGHHKGECIKDHWDCRECLWLHKEEVVGKIFDATTEKTTAIKTDKMRHARFAKRWRYDIEWNS